MNAAARSLILKAQDNLETAKKNIEDEAQHDVVGYNLAQACENYLKALCVERELEFPEDDDGHDLDALMSVLEENNLAAVSSHADLVELTRYNSTTSRVRKDERLDLKECYTQLLDLKELVRTETL